MSILCFGGNTTVQFLSLEQYTFTRILVGIFILQEILLTLYADRYPPLLMYIIQG